MRRRLRWSLVVASVLVSAAACAPPPTDGGEDTTTTTTVPAVPSPPTELATGHGFACALRESGSVACWGDNSSGQLGDGTTTSSRFPVAVLGVDDATSIVAGDSHACAVRTAGTVACWGSGTSGKLGNGETEASPTPVPVTGLSDVVDLESEDNFTCARRINGTVACWGLGGGGYLGDGAATNSSVPVEATGLAGTTDLGVGTQAACALPADGQLACWGLGNQNAERSNQNVPTIVNTMGGISAIDLGSQHGCAIAAGNVYCWGLQRKGEWGTGSTSTNVAAHIAAPVSGLAAATSVSAGRQASCATLPDGSVRCWGRNTEGQLGNGTLADATAPVTVTGLTAATAVDAGDLFACALRGDATVWCWGENETGQLGDGTLSTRTVPVQVQGLTTPIPSLTGSPVASSTVTRVPQGVRITGTATDPDLDPSSFPLVEVSIDGVSRLVPPSGPTFAVILGINAVESATVCVRVLNSGPGANVDLGCTQVPGTKPQAAIRSFEVTGNTVTIAGWAVDFDATLAAFLLVDVKNAAGVVVAGEQLFADGSTTRPGTPDDIPFLDTSVYGQNRGFSRTFTVPAGATEVCVSVENYNAGQVGHRALPCTPLEPPVTPPVSPSYGFMHPGPPPIRYNPCAAIHYVVNPLGASVTELQALRDAIVRIESASGLDFIYDGTTTESWDASRPRIDVARYGRRWSPVVISFDTADRVPEFAGNVAGLAGSSSVETPDGRRVFVTGHATFKRDEVRDMPTGFDPGTSTMASVMTHELAHVVGLTHVGDPRQVMYPSNSLASDLATGDRQGLDWVGAAQGCITVPPPPD